MMVVCPSNFISKVENIFTGDLLPENKFGSPIDETKVDEKLVQTTLFGCMRHSV